MTLTLPTDVPWHGHGLIATRACEPPLDFPLVPFSPWFSTGNLFFVAVMYRSKPTSPKSIRDQGQSTSLAACSWILRRACATGCAPALWVHCSSRTRSSLVMAERATTGPKAVRHLNFFPFCFVLIIWGVCGQSTPMVC